MYRDDVCRRCDLSRSSSQTKCDKCELAYYCSPGCQAKDKWRHEADCDVARVVRKCSECGQQKRNTKECGNCMEVSYCGERCQKRHWPNHKRECLKVSQHIRDVTEELKQRPRVVTELYYWGNVPALDLINLAMNEGSGFSSPLALLLCGVGDPRYVALSLASLPESYQEKVTFVLNDISVCTLARTILLLYMLLEGENDWYSNYI